MMCFITGKYGKALVSGGMIGYVMDSDVRTAIQSVKEAIHRNCTILCLVRNTGLSSCSIMSNEQIIKETRHNLPNRRFTIYHVFVAVWFHGKRIISPKMWAEVSPWQLTFGVLRTSLIYRGGFFMARALKGDGGSKTTCDNAIDTWYLIKYNLWYPYIRWRYHPSQKP